VTPTLKTDGQVCVVPDIMDVDTIAGIPRRLLPIEYERLMGWPDDWTQIPDRHGKASSDTFRYHVCGNGIVSHVTEWIGLRLLAHTNE
jgi:site-specific DNA-cytosine methylase